MHALIVSTVNSRKGGTQRVASILAKGLIARGHRITIAHDREDGDKFAFNMHANIDLFPYDRSQNQKNIIALREMLRRLSPDVCLCMQSTREHLFWAVTILGTGIPLIYSERTSPYIIMSPPRWNELGRTAAMCGADAIHLLCNEYIDTVPAFLRPRVHIIGNPLPDETFHKAQPSIDKNGTYRILSLGRLTKSKDPLLIAKAFSNTTNKINNWELHFWGSGEELSTLKKFIKENNLHDKIFLKGETDSPLSIYQNYNVFCTSSKYEGFSNAVLEALACGLPVVAFKDCTGVNSIIKNKINGFLVEQRGEINLSEALYLIMKNPEQLKSIGENALGVHKAFSHKLILDQWENLLTFAALKKNNTIMDTFTEEPFASRARLSSAARREWILRDNGTPMPHSLHWYRTLIINAVKTFCTKFF
jgi:glycosyltransferase involved in cell wall biosynthesis